MPRSVSCRIRGRAGPWFRKPQRLGGCSRNQPGGQNQPETNCDAEESLGAGCWRDFRFVAELHPRIVQRAEGGWGCFLQSWSRASARGVDPR